jgi:acyl carrier protein
MTRGLSDADRARMGRDGLEPLGAAEALSLFDVAVGRPEPVLIAVRVNPGALRRRAAADPAALPALFRGLVPAVPHTVRAVPAVSWKEQLGALPSDERRRRFTELIRSEIATVLGHRNAAGIDAQTSFQELGFDSLMAVELRNRLGRASGLTLPTTMIFDYPNAEALAGELFKVVFGGADEQPVPAGSFDEAAFRSALSAVPLTVLKDAGVFAILQRLAAGTASDGGTLNEFDEMDVDELVRAALGDLDESQEYS